MKDARVVGIGASHLVHPQIESLLGDLREFLELQIRAGKGRKEGTCLLHDYQEIQPPIRRTKVPPKPANKPNEKKRTNAPAETRKVPEKEIMDALFQNNLYQLGREYPLATLSQTLTQAGIDCHKYGFGKMKTMLKALPEDFQIRDVETNGVPQPFITILRTPKKETARKAPKKENAPTLLQMLEKEENVDFYVPDSLYLAFKEIASVGLDNQTIKKQLLEDYLAAAKAKGLEPRDDGVLFATRFQNREGVIQNESMKLFTSNMNMSQKLLDGLIDCELGLFGSVKRDRTLFDYQKTFYSAATFNPTFPNHKNPETEGWDQITAASQITNPLAWMEVNNQNATSYFSAHARLTLHLMKDLKLILFGSYTYSDSEDSQYLPTSVWAHGQAYRGDRKSESLLGNLMLTYRKRKGSHFFDVLALGELEKDTYKGFYTTATNFSSDENGFNNLQGGALRPWEGTGSYYEDPHLVSFLGRVNYTFGNRYVLTLNARTDASSKFGTNHKWGFFPSASVAWNISEEAFMKRFRYIDNLKIRMGYGLAGNQAGIDSYTTMALVRPNGITPVGNTPLVTYESLRNVNPDLKWEVKRTFNAGFDLGLYGNRLLLSVNYYNSKTTDMLYSYNVSVPPFAYNTLLANLGSMRNSGTEISIGITPLKTKDMELNINANITFQQNKLLSLSGMYNGEYVSASEYTAIAGLNGAGTHGGYNNIVYQIVGQPLGVFYLPHCEGLVSDGQGGYTYQIADLNGGGVNLEDGEDRYIAGQAIPKTLLGSNISFRYKNVDISLQINGAFGHKIYNGTSLSYMNMNSLPDYNVLEDAPGQMIKDQTATDYWLENGNYVNFDYLTVGWTVPLKHTRFLKGLRLAGTINNLGTISSYSGLTPLINSSLANNTLGVDDKRTYPLSRTYTVSLNLNF